MLRRIVFAGTAACVLAVSFIAVQGRGATHGPSPATAANGASAAVTSDDIERPPAGRWRLAPAASLEHVVLFFSHVLVRHAGSTPAEAPFSAADWPTLPPPPARSRAAALALARDVAERARRAPDSFSQLVERYSEDALSRPRGGSVGALPASQLVSHPELLDALAALKPGEVSGVLETPYGFHVLRRAAPPPACQIAGRHIVIGHDAAPWLAFQSRPGGVAVTRSRQAARAIARRIAAELAAVPEPERFAAFRARATATSEHRDAAQGGDLGVWSSREPTHLRWQLDTLAKLRVGEVSEPIETPLGTEILLRTPVEPRARLAMSAIKFRFDPEAAEGHSLSRNAVLARAKNVLSFVREQPDRFADWQRQYCCVEPEAWSEGRGDAALTAALKELPIGTVAEHPIEVEHNLVLARRVAAPDPRPVAFDLPAPSEPDLEYLVEHATAAGASAFVRGLPATIAPHLALTDAQRAAVDRAHRKLADALDVLPADQRVDALYAAQLALHDELGAESFERYIAAVRAEVTKLLLGQG